MTAQPNEPLWFLPKKPSWWDRAVALCVRDHRYPADQIPCVVCQKLALTGTERTTDEPMATMLERRGVITTDPERQHECCGLPRDADGFCSYRPGHPIYVAK